MGPVEIPALVGPTLSINLLDWKFAGFCLEIAHLFPAGNPGPLLIINLFNTNVTFN